MCKAYRKMGGLNSCGQFWKAAELMMLLRQLRPRTIIEFGSGLSTFVFIDYICRNACTLTVVEEDHRWIESIRATTNNIQLNPASIVDWRHCRRFVNRESVDYDYELEGQVDLMFVDGPSLIINGVSEKQLICNQAVRLADNVEGHIVISGRKQTVNAVGRLGSFEGARTTFGSFRLFSNRYFSVFSRSK